MKGCELCEFPARMYCESDEASLCWDCDAKVHSANFLVARHSRCLLCQVCQSATPWRATGAKLGPTVSICEACVKRCNERPDTADQEDEGENEEEEEEDENGEDDGESEEYDDEEEEEEEEEEDGENQVVPWTSTPSSLMSAPIASSSSEESSSRLCNVADSVTASFSLKRLRENADPATQGDDPGCLPSQANWNQNQRNEDDEATSYGSFRPSKDRKRASSVLESPESDSRVALFDALKRLQKEKSVVTDASATVLDICKLSKDPRPIDVVSTGSESPPT